MKVNCLFDELVDVKILRVHPKNRNQHPPDQIDRLAKILKYQGWRYPIKVSKLSGYITSGHGRLLAAIKNKEKQVPVNFQEYDDADQEYADIQADSSIASWSELDLSGINVDLADLDPSFDIEMLGIKNFTIEPADKYADQDADKIPDVKQNELGVQLGDIYQLGDHRLMCGDSTDKQTVEKLMNGKKADIVVTDPPYGVSYDPSWRQDAADAGHLSKAARAIGKVANDNRSDWTEAYQNFDAPIIYVWHGGKLSGEIAEHLIKCGYKIISQIIWNKPMFAISRGDYHWKHEPCWYAVKEGQNHNWQGSRSESTVWDINRGCEEKTGHGTEKPVECMERPIRNNTSTNQLVADPFLGSGTTVIACEKTKRVCYGMELDPHYCSVIIKRWEQFTHKKASKLT